MRVFRILVASLLLLPSLAACSFQSTSPSAVEVTFEIFQERIVKKNFICQQNASDSLGPLKVQVADCFKGAFEDGIGTSVHHFTSSQDEVAEYFCNPKAQYMSGTFFDASGELWIAPSPNVFSDGELKEILGSAPRNQREYCDQSYFVDDEEVSQLAEIESAVTGVYPACKFETISVVTGKTYLDSSNARNRAIVTYRLNDFNWTESGADGIVFRGAGANDDYRVCNTKGKTLDSLGVKNYVNGNGLEEDLGFTFCSPAQAKRFSLCKSRIEKKSKLGFWFVIHDFGTKDAAIAHMTPKLEFLASSGTASYPFAVVGSYVVAPTGPFDDVNFKTITDFDDGWIDFIAKTNAVRAADLVDGYPKVFNRRYWDTFRIKTGKGSRIDLDIVRGW